MVETRAERGQDGILLVAPRADDEREPELFAIGLVEGLEEGDFLTAQPVQSGAGLFARRFRRERALDGGAAGEIGMGLDELDLPRFSGAGHGPAKGLVQLVKVGERSMRPGGLGNPRR